MDLIIKQSIERGISYQDYRGLLKSLVNENSNTGLDKNADLANYTVLNDKRMKRWDKTIKVPEVAQQKIEAISKSMTWLIITESWCGDAAHVMPVLNKIAELNSKIEIKVVLRDENLQLMDQFLTNGGRAIAKVIMIDNEAGTILNTYGPRPTMATQLVNDYKAEHGKLTPEFKEDLQQWYNKDKGQNIISDIVEMLGE